MRALSAKYFTSKSQNNALDKAQLKLKNATSVTHNSCTDWVTILKVCSSPGAQVELADKKNYKKASNQLQGWIIPIDQVITDTQTNLNGIDHIHTITCICPLITDTVQTNTLRAL